jgi:transposase
MESLFSYLSCEAGVPQDHPLRPIRTIVDQSLTVLSPAFDALYSDIGRPPIPPEKLLRALLLQAFYSVRSERQLMEQLDYNLLFRWFVGLAMDAPIWDVTVFTKNRDRFLAGDVAAKFLAAAGLSPRTVVACVDATAVRHLEGEDSMRDRLPNLYVPNSMRGGRPAVQSDGRRGASGSPWPGTLSLRLWTPPAMRSIEAHGVGSTPERGSPPPE